MESYDHAHTRTRAYTHTACSARTIQAKLRHKRMKEEGGKEERRKVVGEQRWPGKGGHASGISCMHTRLCCMHADHCVACPRDKPQTKATVASHCPPTDPREPHGSLLFHCLPSARASRWPRLLCNMHTTLLGVSVRPPQARVIPTLYCSGS